MSFTSPVFLFIFLPFSLILYFIADRRYKNLIALAASLVFFAWGELYYVPLMLLLIVVNFYLGRQIEQSRETPQGRSQLLAGIAFNIALLVFFKLITSYGAGWLAVFLPEDAVAWISRNPFPLGISYVAFQVISYLIDVSNEMCDSEQNFLDFSLYVLLFPKIIVGPITRYRDLCDSLKNREVTRLGVANGIRRFVLGFAKKALIADTLSRVVNPAFGLPTPGFSTGIAWLVLIAYTLQLYFDFSGYTDMAIGLGQMLGFRFIENFNYPYLARSISDFWRRWHISLSTWFRDYVFYPLEFTRRRQDRLRQQLHIFVVFLLTGLWHGLTLTFALWGMLHGLALALEMSGFGRKLKKAWRPLQHIYALSVVMLGWVFFRSATPAFAVQFLARLFGSQQGLQQLPFSVTRPLPIIENSVWLALVLGIFFSFPILPVLQKRWQSFAERYPRISTPALYSSDLLLLFLLISSMAATLSSSYVGSIYGNF